jgi:hypothetical protein
VLVSARFLKADNRSDCLFVFCVDVVYRSHVRFDVRLVGVLKSQRLRGLAGTIKMSAMDKGRQDGALDSGAARLPMVGPYIMSKTLGVGSTGARSASFFPSDLSITNVLSVSQEKFDWQYIKTLARGLPSKASTKSSFSPSPDLRPKSSARLVS